MKRSKWATRAAIGMIAASAVGGAAIGTLPVGHVADVRPAVTSIDPAQLYNTAQQNFASGDVASGLAALQQVLTIAPADTDALALQAIWSDQVSDAATRDAALRRLGVLNPPLAMSARNIISSVADAAKIVPDTTPKQVSGRAAVVILGYGLNGNGTMAPELVNRLKAGKSQADSTTTLPIVVTGGAPKNGITEASAMKKWLTSNGVDAARVTAEDRSGSTVANAQNTVAILAPLGISNIILVTSPAHIRRAAADFGATGLRVAATVTTPTELDKYQTPLTIDQQKGIRLEATRTAKIPVTHQAGVPIPQIPGAPQNLPDTGPGLLGQIAGPVLKDLLDAGSSATNGQ